MSTPNVDFYDLLVAAFDENIPPREQLMQRVAKELDCAYAKYGTAPWSRHEFYAILKEEVDELWDDVKADAHQDQVETELVHVAAMCFRYFETVPR